MDYFMWIDKDDTFEGRRMEAKLAVQLGLFDSTALFLSFFFLIHHCFGRFVSIRFEFCLIINSTQWLVLPLQDNVQWPQPATPVTVQQELLVPQDPHLLQIRTMTLFVTPP